MFCCLFDISWTAIAIISTVLIGIYYYFTRENNYWTSRGINGPKPVFLLGNFGDLFFKPMNEIEEERLEKYGNVYGAFFGPKPLIVVGEPELVKNIMVKDFNVMINRNNFTLDDPIMDRMLSALRDDEWKKMRSVISPTFSSGKMRKMHKLFEQCVKSADEVVDKAAKGGKDIDLKVFMGNYTMDVIATCAFATKTDTHNDPNNLFIKYSNVIFNGNFLRSILFFTMKPLMKLLNFSPIDPNAMNFFISAIKEIMRKRSNDKVKHHDFLQLMLNAQKNVDNEDESEDKEMDAESHHSQEDRVQLVYNKSKIEVTENDILATSFLFFVAGYETTANLLTYLFYELALNTDYQQKLLEEILENRDQNGNIDYDKIVRMPYLDACISETLRLYNPAQQSSRITSEDYPLGDTGITIPKDMIILIPIHAIHHNPEYYPNPHTFDPERFMPENRDRIIPYTYLPFGAGPRNCVGMRFALLEAKCIVAHLIAKYNFIRTERTQVPLQFIKYSGFMKAKDVTVGVEHR